MGENSDVKEEPTTRRSVLKRTGLAVGSVATAGAVFSTEAEAKFSKGTPVRALNVGNAEIWDGVGLLGPQGKLGTITPGARGTVLREKEGGFGRTYTEVAWFNDDPTGFTRALYIGRRDV